MHSNHPFIQAQDNLKYLVRAHTSRDYNKYLFNQINITNKTIILCLNIFAPVIYIVNIAITLVFVTYKCFASLFVNRWRVKDEEYKNFNELYLFFINHFPDRCKSAKVFDQSKYWVVGPEFDFRKCNLEGKVVVDYRYYLTKLDSFKIFVSSISFIFEYILKVRNLCLIHKIWFFYEVEYSLKRIGKNSVLYYSNQSDKYALLFDSIESKSKVLIQHGIVANWGPLPYRLAHTTEFYAMSNRTWQDAYNNLLSNSPHLVIMEPTITLFKVPQAQFNVLIVAEMDYINIEKEILAELSNYKSICVYLKKHPALQNDGSYRELQEKYGFNYITEKIFPEVDFVISYYSTLAYEYMAYEIPVYMYMTKEEFSKEELMQQLKQSIEATKRSFIL